MAQRLDLQALLELLLGTRNVYFQPPPDVELQYPCIVYSRSDIPVDYADNMSYRKTWEYKLTYIDRHPDSPMLDKLIDLPLCKFDRSYSAETLNHYVYNIFF